ncbi:MAG: TolC family protein, partial [Bacteroidales bacterium]|nr:TolC family protein [Bacteroidales bacterium]
QTLRQVEAEVRRAAQDKQAAFAAYRQAEKRAALQEEAYRLNKKKFQQGLVSPLDFRKASEQCLNAKSACLQNELQYRIKDSVLAYFSGIPYIEQF